MSDAFHGIDVFGDLETGELTSDGTEGGVGEEVEIEVVGDIEERHKDGGVPVEGDSGEVVDSHVCIREVVGGGWRVSLKN